MDWKKVVGTVAPTIATAIGGPMGGMAVKLISDALGVEPDEQAIQKTVASGDPEVFAKLKIAEHDFQARMKELDIDLAEIHAKDRASARTMARDTGVNYQFTIVCSLTVIIAAIVGALFYIVMQEININQTMMNLVSTILGMVLKAWGDSVQFFTGSSLGSKLKSAMTPGK